LNIQDKINHPKYINKARFSSWKKVGTVAKVQIDICNKKGASLRPYPLLDSPSTIITSA